MRIPCPHCGERDLREFSCRGSAVMIDRPAPDAGDDAWADYVHLRENPAGEARDLFQHTPCGTWIVVTRNTVTHEVTDAVAAREARA